MFGVQKQNTQATTIPSPVRGINSLSSLYGMQPTDAIYLYNIIPKEFGLTVRKGTREHVTGLANPVLTVMSYRNVLTGAEQIFAATIDGIYDVTVRTDTPGAPVLAWPSQAGGAGYCSFTQWVGVGGAAYLLVADAVNGYYIYDGATWEAGTFTGGGPNPADVDFVTVWKSRLWFVEKNSADAWYLPPAALTGTPVLFTFGNKFRQGDGLVGIYNWTIDGGEGGDDYLVAVGRGGDVIVYRGSDPAQSATFDMVGSWYIGPIPAGHRITNDYGGDLLVLSSFGLVSLRSMIEGAQLGDNSKYVSAPISPYIREVMRGTLEDIGWEVRVDPDEGVVIIMSPERPGKARTQFVMYISTQAWCMYRGLDMDCGWYAGTSFYYGKDNVVIEMAGTLEGVSFDGVAREPIPWALLTSYQDYDAPARWKRMQFMRPLFIAEYAPDYTIHARYDFDVTDLGTLPVSLPKDGSLWDEALWDDGIWGGGFSVIQQPKGGSGMGRHVAVQVIGRSSFRTTFVGVDVMLDGGGML